MLVPHNIPHSDTATDILITLLRLLQIFGYLYGSAVKPQSANYDARNRRHCALALIDSPSWAGSN